MLEGNIVSYDLKIKNNGKGHLKEEFLKKSFGSSELQWSQCLILHNLYHIVYM